MDLAYWGFRRWPFQRSHASEHFFFSKAHDEAMARLLYLVEESRRLGLVTGPSGTGKTYLLKILQRRAQRLGRLVISCEATGIDSTELIAQIADGCSLPRPQNGSIEQVWSGIRKKLEALALVRQPLLVVNDHFEEPDIRRQRVIVRLLQLADSIGTKLTVVAATRDQDIPFAFQEITELRIDLAEWTEEETFQFIAQSIERAGSSARIFTDEAISSIYEFTQGNPAKATSLCHMTLLAAQGMEQSLVTSELVNAAACEIPSGIRQVVSYGIKK